MLINSFGFCSSSSSLMKELADVIGVSQPINSLIESDLKKQLRSSGAFITAGVRAAAETLHNSGITQENLATTGIIVTSRIGDQNTTSEFIDDLIDYGIDQGSPLKFAHSVHNAAASYIANKFNIYGPAITAVNFESSFLNGLTLAQCWLEQGTCDNVLLLQIESCSMLSWILTNYANNRAAQFPLRPTETTAFADSKAQCVAACFLLSNHALRTDGAMKISLSHSQENGDHQVEPLPIETPLTDPILLMSAILKTQKKQLVKIAETTYLIEKT